MSLSQYASVRLRPLLKGRVWGGRRLASMGFELPPGPIGEAWLLADLGESIPEGRTPILDGPSSGLALCDLSTDCRAELFGSAKPSSDGGFPLLVKILDACRNLSVQVHPTAEYTASHPGTAVKNEAWVILAAEPGAELYTGLRPIGLGEFRTRAARGDLADAMTAVPARVGDCHVLRSGTCHALGAGIVVAEVQTPSDTTFRVDDWGRRGRDLHLEQAIECIYGPAADDDALPLVAPLPSVRVAEVPPIESGGVTSRSLALTADFAIERLDAVKDTEIEIVTDVRPTVFIGLDGALELRGPDDLAFGGGPLRAGHLALVPACAEDTLLRMKRGAAVLRVDLPIPVLSPTHNADPGRAV